MIPPFDAVSGQLPPGEHPATWVELCERFGGTAQRDALLQELGEVLRLLARAGCRRVDVDGSFVTRKAAPDDVDACWDTAGVDLDRLDERLWRSRSAQASNVPAGPWRCDLYIADAPADGLGLSMREFFQFDRNGLPKGIVVIDPQECLL